MPIFEALSYQTTSGLKLLRFSLTSQFFPQKQLKNGAPSTFANTLGPISFHRPWMKPTVPLSLRKTILRTKVKKYILFHQDSRNGRNCTSRKVKVRGHFKRLKADIILQPVTMKNNFNEQDK